MRKLRWPIAITTLLALVAFAFVFKSSDPFAELKPYLTNDSTTYYSDDQMEYRTVYTRDSASKVRSLTLEGITEEQLTPVLNGFSRRNNLSTVWLSSGRGKIPSRFHFLSGGQRTAPYLEANSDLEESHYQPNTKGTYYIEMGLPISKWDVWFYKACHRGKDPFDHPVPRLRIVR